MINTHASVGAAAEVGMDLRAAGRAERFAVYDCGCGEKQRSFRSE